MAPHSSTLAWKIPWIEEPGRLQSMGSLRVWTQLSDFTFTFHFHALEKEMAARCNVLAWRIPGTGEPGGLPSMGSHRVRHDWSDLASLASKKITVCKGGWGDLSDKSILADTGNWDVCLCLLVFYLFCFKGCTIDYVYCSKKHLRLRGSDS